MTVAPRERWAGMPVAHFEDLVDYLAVLGGHLELRDWTLSLYRLPLDDDEEAFAQVVPTYGQKRATVHLCRDFAKLDPDTALRVLVHELLHCHLDSVERHLDEVLPDLVGKPIADLIGAAVHERIEFAVDAIADAIAPHLPPLPAKNRP